MEDLLLIISGFLTGFIYNEQIYQKSKKGKNPLLTFPLRFLLLAVVLYFVVNFFGIKGTFEFFISHLFGRFLQLIYRIFIKA